ncbi:MAG: FHA domain-containing protein [Pirellulales bacterium]|nr:FHA domain-containing protein [Pirellulales bacterium]
MNVANGETLPMFQAWRIQLREAELAFAAGRLEEAHSILGREGLDEFHQAQKLRHRIAERMVDRGADLAAKGETQAGWRDLERGAQLGADTRHVATVRRSLIERLLGEVENLLRLGHTEQALHRLEELAARHALTREARALDTVVRRVANAERFMRRGKFSQAEAEWLAAIALRPDLTTLEERRRACSLKATELRRLSQRLHEGMAAANWSDVLATAEQLLVLSPGDAPAREARRRAWSAVGTRLADSAMIGPRLAAARVTLPGPRQASPPVAIMNNSQPGHAPSGKAGARFLMWVDSVGGFLVCDGDEVTLGQPIAGQQVEIPLLGDLSGRHAIIRRDGEGYLLEALRPTRVSGRPVEGAALLTDGATIELGEGVVLRFRRPHPLSSTARIEFVSRHRTQPAADAVILLGESCVLGPSSKAHITCRDWTQDVVLVRQGNELYCQSSGAFAVDGVEQSERVEIGRSSQITGEDFAISLEPL